MSHYTVAVLVPDEHLADRGSTDEFIVSALAPFDENTEVAPYPDYLSEDPDSFNSLERMIKIMGAEKLEGPFRDREAVENLRNEIGMPSLDNREGLKRYWKMWSDKDLHFDDEGKAYEYSTYNPKSKWDWYSVGGRWNGLWEPVEGCYLGGNAAPVMNIVQASQADSTTEEDYRTFAVLTPDGEWYERGRMMWWAIVDNEKDEDTWDAEFDRLLQANPETVAVLVDAHI